MTLLAAPARRRNAEQAPLEPPYNAPAPLVTPTYEGSGQAVHPDVIDMVQRTGQTWNGYRYWMAMTPYPYGNDTYEDPSILASHNGITWEVPPGLVNPIDPNPPTGYNSDTDIEWDADNQRMVCYWRDYAGGSGPDNLTYAYSISTDGVTWTAQGDLFTVTYPDPSVAQLSPAVSRVGPGDWRMWLVGNGGPSQVRTSGNALGPWSAGTDLTFNGTVSSTLHSSFWHWNVIHVSGTFYGLVSTRGSTFAYMYTMTSANGIDWTVNTPPVMTRGIGKWDARLYRPSIIHAGDRMRVWYSAFDDAGAWRIGYTEMPLAEWPTP